MDAGLDQFEEAKEKAYEQADLDNIITMDMISQILFAQNFAMPAGYIEEDGIQYMVSVGDEIVDEDEINNLLLMDMHMDGLDQSIYPMWQMYFYLITAVMCTPILTE